MESHACGAMRGLVLHEGAHCLLVRSGSLVVRSGQRPRMPEYRRQHRDNMYRCACFASFAKGRSNARHLAQCCGSSLGAA